MATVGLWISMLVIPHAVYAAVSDENARMWIASALAGKPALNDEKARHTVGQRRKAGALFAAWKKLKECRDAGKSLDLDLAAAEHYLFIRAFAAEKGEQDIEGLPILYGQIKDYLGPAAQLLKTSEQPVSPPDAAVIRWGSDGVLAGLLDYTAATKQQPKPKTGSYQQFKLAIEGYYQNYAQTLKAPTCNVAP